MRPAPLFWILVRVTNEQQALKALASDPRFKKLIEKHGTPVWRPRGTAFRSLARAIIHQQVSTAAARSIEKKFLSLFPRGSFPTPARVAALSVHQLRAAGLSAQKATYLHDLAAKFSDGTIRHRKLRHMTNDELVAHLTQVKGIGVWTVHMFLIFTLRRPDVLPTADLGIRKGFQAVYGLRDLPDAAAMERKAAAWRPHASYASWYLWRAAGDAAAASKPSSRSRS